MSEEDQAAAAAEDESADAELDAAIAALSQEHDPGRDRRIWWWLFAAGLAVLAVFLYFFWPVMQGRLNAVKQLDQSQALLGQAENTVAEIDKAVATQLSPDPIDPAPNVSAQILVARRELGQASTLVDSAMPHLTEDEQTRGTQLRTAIKARLTMVDRAPAILTASAKAVRAKALGDQGWTLSVKAGAAQARDVGLYRQQTALAVEQVAVGAPTILTELDDARSLFSQAASAFPEAGFGRYLAYVDLQRQAAVTLGVAASRWLKNDKPGAAIEFAQSTTASTNVGKALAALPGAPGKATGAGFHTVAGTSVDAYAKAKQQAELADKALKSP